MPIQIEDEELLKIEIFGCHNKLLSTTHPEYFCIKGEGKGDQGVELRPKLTGAIDAPVKSLWLPGAFGQVFVDFRWERRDVVFTVFIFDPVNDTASGYHTQDALWRQSWDYVKETTIRYTYQDETMDTPDVRELRVRLLEEPKAYDSDTWEGKDPHLFHCGNVVMTVAAELPFYTGETKTFEWISDPGDFAAEVNFTGTGPTPSSFTKVGDSGAGGVSVVNGKWTWVESGVLGAGETWLYTDGEPESDSFETAITMSDAAEGGLFAADLRLIGRSDATASNYVFCSIVGGLAHMGTVRNGVLTWFTFLPSYIPQIQPGHRIAFAGTGTQRFRLKVDDVTVATAFDTGNVGPKGAGFRKGGVQFIAGPDFIGGQVIPPKITKFELRDVPSTDSASHTFVVDVPCDVPVWPRWTLTDNADWILPDYSFGNEEYGRPLEDADRTVPLPHLAQDEGAVVNSDPRRQTLLVANRAHAQGRWKGQDLLYPIPSIEDAQLEVQVNNAEDGYACRLEVQMWYTRPWGRPMVYGD